MLVVEITGELGFTIGARAVDGVKRIVVEHVEAGSKAHGVQDGDWIVRVDGADEIAVIVGALESQKRPLRIALQRPSPANGAARSRRSWRCCGGCFVMETPPLESASVRAEPAASVAMPGGTAGGSSGAAPARRGRRRKPRSKAVAKAGLAIALLGIVLAAIWPWLTEAEGDRDARIASLGDCPNIFVRVRTLVEGLLADDEGGTGGMSAAVARAVERGAVLLVMLYTTDAPPPSPAALRVGAIAQIAVMLWTIVWSRRVVGHLRRVCADDANDAAAAVAAAAAAAVARHGGEGASAGAVDARGEATGDVDGAWDAALLAALLPGPFVASSSAAMSFALEVNGGAPAPTASALALAAALGCAALTLAAAQHVGRCDADAHAARAAPRAQQTLAALLLSGALCFASLCVALEAQLPWRATLRRA